MKSFNILVILKKPNLVQDSILKFPSIAAHDPAGPSYSVFVRLRVLIKNADYH